MNEIELKGKNIEKWVGGALLLVGCFFIAPFIALALKGLLGLLAAGALIAITYYAGPAIGRLLGNMRIKALKAVAAAYPIETLEAELATRKSVLVKQRENIKQRITIKKKIETQIETFENQFKKPSPRRKMYDMLNQLIDISVGKYEKAQVNLVAFNTFIDERRADWDIACSMAEASKLAEVGKSFTDELMKNTALTTIQQGLDMAFAELDASVMDENIDKILSGQDVQISISPSPEPAKPKMLSSSTLSELDFDFNGQPEPVKVAASSKR